MIQSSLFNTPDLINAAEVVYKIVNKAKDLSNKVSLDDAIKTSDLSGKILPNLKKIRMGIILTNNEIKDINKHIFKHFDLQLFF